ncbi:hypothetical protein HWV62_11287 [Athelia sp. TMB]|nr:hypothetical protein HWV62_11287 [Athelia sp. TMB]
MSSLAWGSIFGGLAVLGIVATITSLQLKYLDHVPSNRQPKDLFVKQSGSPLQAGDNGPVLPALQASELEPFAEAIQALRQAKAVIACKWPPILVLPIDGLLDVVEACSTNGQDTEVLIDIHKAMIALDRMVDAALAHMRQLVGLTQSNSQGSSASGSLCGDLVDLDLLLDNLSVSTKRITAQIESSTVPPRADIVRSIISAIQDFSLCVEDIIAARASRGTRFVKPSNTSTSGSHLQLSGQDIDSAPDQRLCSTNPTVGLVMNASHLDGSSSLPSLTSQGTERKAEIKKGAGVHPIANRQGSSQHATGDSLAQYTLENSPLSDVLFGATVAVYTQFEVLVQIFCCSYHTFVAFKFRTRFVQSGRLSDLEQAIGYHRSALELCPPGQFNHPINLYNLALALCARFSRSGQMEDLEEAIRIAQSAVELCSSGHPRLHISLDNLAIALRMRFSQLGQIADLEQAIAYHQSAVELCPTRNPARPSSINNLAVALRIRFNNLGEIRDLEQAIDCYRSVMELCPVRSPDYSIYLNNLASALRTRFNQTSRIADLEEAITCGRRALELCTPGHSNYVNSLDSVAVALRTRFLHLGHIEDLEEAIIYHQSTFELCPPGHPDHFNSLNSLALALSTRFHQLGHTSDLEQAITHFRSAFGRCPPGHPDRPNFLSNLASELGVRFHRLGQIGDLEQAIYYHRSALELYPLEHSNYPMALFTLAVALCNRFTQSGDMADLDESITLHHKALTLYPPGHYNYPISLVDLASALGVRFFRLGQMGDLEQAIDHLQSALELWPLGHPERSTSFTSLGLQFSARFDHLSQMVDLEQAITYYRSALELCPSGHFNHSANLINLARALCTRFNHSGHIPNLEEAIKLLQLGSNDASDTPKHRYNCASRLVALLEEHNLPLLLEAYESALSLLQLVLAVYPDVELRQEALGSDHLSPSLAMSAAARAIEQDRPEKAIEMLESGRGMLYSNVRGYRQPIEAVRQVDAKLADRFKATSEQLEALATTSQMRTNQLLSTVQHESAAVSEARWKRQRELTLERDEIIENIHCLPGFEYFLKAVPFSELRVAAAEGPVIIVNVAQRRSDAIILCRHDAPIVLPLCADGQSREEVYSAVLDMSKLLFERRGMPGFSQTLKDNILKTLAELLVIPVLQGLERLGVPEQSRVWWCPTSALCALPIHAAGELPNKYVSSYTPTLSALIGARKAKNQQSPALNGRHRKPSLLAIIYPGHPPKIKGDLDDRLLTVFTEYNVIEKAGRDSQVCDVVRTEAARQQVLDNLPLHPWVHFACHGRLDTSEPFRSHFELGDQPLSLSDLIQARLPNTDFAFLAACDSATSGGTSSTPNESLHLAAAVQFCGVHSVVGTLWPMADVDGPRMAQVFYRHMFKGDDPRRSAEALHKAVTAMRKKTGPWKKTADEGELLQRWANYVHIGA